MISQHYFTFPFYLGRVYRLFQNWPAYLYNYLTRQRRPAQYVMRNGLRINDGTGTLAGTLAVVFIRREYGPLESFETILDVGANMGCFSLCAATSSPRARIYAFEPEARNFEILSGNIRSNGLSERVIAENSAVAARGGLGTLALGASPLHSLVIRENDQEVEQRVKCITLPEIVEKHGLSKIDLLKLNCEGAEYEILEHCPEELRQRIGEIRLEYHTMNGEGQNGPSLAKRLERWGYKITRFTNYRGVSGFIWARRQK